MRGLRTDLLFREVRPDEVEQELTQKDQFNTDRVPLAATLVRELLQNSTDAYISGYWAALLFRWASSRRSFSSAGVSTGGSILSVSLSSLFRMEGERANSSATAASLVPNTVGWEEAGGDCPYLVSRLSCSAIRHTISARVRRA